MKQNLLDNFYCTWKGHGCQHTIGPDFQFSAWKIFHHQLRPEKFFEPTFNSKRYNTKGDPGDNSEPGR